MKVIMLSLASNFTEDMNYQDNLLAIEIAKLGHEVTIIADCHTYSQNEIITLKEEDKIITNNIRLIRKKYVRVINTFISNKIRAIRGLTKLMNDISPDIIFHHSLHTFELFNIAKYKKKNPKVKFYLDSHEDFHNSATNFLSKYLLHKIYYNFVIHHTKKHVDKIFYVSFESLLFLKKMYRLKEENLEYYPLGGQIIGNDQYYDYRKSIRYALNIQDNELLISHSGKFDKKKKTIEMIESFISSKTSGLKLLLMGVFSEDIKFEAMELIKKSNRIIYMGWIPGPDLLKYLCGSDVYIQPGSQSATLQNAICLRCAIATYPHSSYKYLLDNSAVYLKSSNEMINFFKLINKDKSIIDKLKIDSYRIALVKLDYRVQALRLFDER